MATKAGSVRVDHVKEVQADTHVGTFVIDCSAQLDFVARLLVGFIMATTVFHIFSNWITGVRVCVRRLEGNAYRGQLRWLERWDQTWCL
jgi:hypothetical protein